MVPKKKQRVLVRSLFFCARHKIRIMFLLLSENEMKEIMHGKRRMNDFHLNNDNHLILKWCVPYNNHKWRNAFAKSNEEFKEVSTGGRKVELGKAGLPFRWGLKSSWIGTPFWIDFFVLRCGLSCLTFLCGVELEYELEIMISNDRSKAEAAFLKNEES